MPDKTRAAVQGAVESVVGTDWSAQPSGWVGEIEAGLLDAVLSVRATYGRPDTGVRAAVARWRQSRGGSTIDDLEMLRPLGAEQLAETVANRQRLTRSGLKTAAILQVADTWSHLGVRRADDLRACDDAQRAGLVDVPGLGPLTWEYLMLVLSVPDRPTSPRLRSFVSEAIGAPASEPATEVVIAEVADSLAVPVPTIELAVWRHMGRRRSTAA